MGAITSGIKELIIDFTEEEFYDLYHYLCFDAKLLKNKSGIVEQFNERKQKTYKITDFIHSSENEAKDALKKVENNNEYCKKEGLKSYLFNKITHPLLANFFLLLFGFPFFVYGAINNYIPYIIPSKINNKLRGDKFTGPINVLAGTVSALIFWTIQTILVSAFTDNYIWLIYLVSLPIMGELAFSYFIMWKKTKGKLAYNKLYKQNNEDFKRVKSNHDYLVGLFNKF
jgi:hypothetical protein